MIRPDHTGDNARGTMRKPEDRGERETAKRQDSMITSCLSEQESTRRDIQEVLRPRGRYYIGSVEECEDKNANMRWILGFEGGLRAGVGRGMG